jgi:integrase
MSKVRFYIKEPDATGESLISLYFSYNKKRLVYSTGQKILPKFWSNESQRAKETKQFPQYPDLNARLDNLSHETLNIYRRFLNDGKVPSIAQFKSELDIFTLRGAVAGETSLFGFVEQFTKERASLPKFSKGTIQVYQRTLKHLKTYAQTKRRQLDFEDIDLDFFYDFQKYLYSPPVSYAQNSAQKIVKTIKTILNEATDRGINKNLAYKSRRFGIAQVEAENIYLTIDELQKIYRLNLTYLPRVDKTRDLFLIGAFTGFRFSDFTNIKPENMRTVDGVEVIQMTTQKTGEAVTVPVHPIVRAILEKYKGEIPKPISNQKMNDYLKELAELAELNEKVIVTKDRGGKRYDRQFKKWELVTTHTARRSFATNAFKAGIPALSIMKITGHRTEAAFMKYIKISKEENAVLISQNAFFKTSPLKAVR